MIAVTGALPTLQFAHILGTTEQNRPKEYRCMGSEGTGLRFRPIAHPLFLAIFKADDIDNSTRHAGKPL